MSRITASQLRTEGIAAIEKRLAGDCEAVITVRGETRFIVIDMQHYNYLRECELYSRSNDSLVDNISNKHPHVQGNGK